MHEVHTRRNGVSRVQVVAHSTSQHESKGQVLPLSPSRPFRPFRVDIPDAEAQVRVGRNPPAARHEIAPNAHIVSKIACFRTSWNRGSGTRQREIPISS